MDYPEASNHLFGLRRFGQRPGTESAADLLAELDDPHEELPAVQVAGSNGKGSTARMTERVLREAGLSVGLFTSPHLEDLRERVQVDGRKIPEGSVVEFVERTREYVVERGAEASSPTFFEATTAMALWHFARSDVDVAILEVGIGGRLDATSVVEPIASGVTTVELEHTDVLGDDVAEIARDKAHVAPADRPLVTAASGRAAAALEAVAGEVAYVRREGARAGSSPADDGSARDTDNTAADDATGGDTTDGDATDGDATDGDVTDGDATDGDGESPDPADSAPALTVRYGGRVNHTEAAVELDGPDWSVDTRLPVPGAHQAENAGVASLLAEQVLDALGRSLSTDALARGLRGAHWPARFEVTGTDPLVVLDGAHNPGACRRLADVLAEYEYENLTVVFGAMHDKAHREMIAGLPEPDAVCTCRPDLDRAADPAVLARAVENAVSDSDTETGDDGAVSVSAGGSVQGTVDRAIEAAEPGDCVLVTGSLYTVGEARARWTRTQRPRRVEDLGEAREVLSDAGVSDPGVWRMRGKTVHRVVETRLQRRQAEYVKQELLSLGGECAVAALEHDGELVRVVLSGTLSQFRRLARALEDQPYGLPRVGEELRHQLGIEVPEPTPTYPWQEGAAVMGILNVTPDSFHDGGEYDRLEDARQRAASMVDAGVDVVDVGGESTRPGAEPVSVAEERDRVVPVIEAIADCDALVSVDTRKADVAEAALEAGADVVNDVSGLEDPAMRFVAAEHDAPVVVTHSIETPVAPDRSVTYDDVVRDVVDELHERVLLAERAGLDRDQILVDPGLGFGKTPEESFELLDRLDELGALGCPVLVGHSHKSMFEQAGYEHGERLEPTVAATALAVDRGADVVRVHDVSENLAALRIAEATDPGTDR